MKKNNKSLGAKLSKNPWMISTFVLAVLVVALGVQMIPSNNAKTVGMSFADFVGNNGGASVEVLSAESFSDDLYELNVLAEGEEFPVHVTKDGKYWVQLYADLDPEQQTGESPANEPEASAPQAETPEVVKSDDPEVELFVMTHCPYGTQAEKGFLPAMKALDGIADLKIRFVHYFMHTNEEEEVETPRQVCIREEQPEKFVPYLECFLGSSGTVADGIDCQEEVGVDAEALTECIASGKAEEYYAEDSKLSEEYGVRGSPTVVVNGEIAEVGRSAQAYGDVTCEAFNVAPEECGELSLDSASPSPGFGYSASTSGSATTAQC